MTTTRTIAAPACLHPWPGLVAAWRDGNPASALGSAGAESVALWIPELPPGLNSGHGLMRMNHREATRRKRGWWQLVYLALAPRLNALALPWQRARVVFTRVTSSPMDWDNQGASFKFVGDALKQCGVVPDDAPKHIVGLDLRQEIVKPKAPKGVLVVVMKSEAGA